MSPARAPRWHLYDVADPWDDVEYPPPFTQWQEDLMARVERVIEQPGTRKPR